MAFVPSLIFHPPAWSAPLLGRDRLFCANLNRFTRSNIRLSALSLDSLQVNTNQVG